MAQDGPVEHGARVYSYADGVVLVKQTIMRSGRYVIDTDSRGSHKERHVDPGDDRLLGEIVRLAGKGKL
jgi:hypothetical protein